MLSDRRNAVDELYDTSQDFIGSGQSSPLIGLYFIMYFFLNHVIGIIYSLEICKPSYLRLRAQLQASCFARQTGSFSILQPFLIYPCRYRNKGISQDAVYNVKVQNIITSYFARQTGCDSIFKSFIDWSLFSQERVIRDAEHKVWKCRHFVSLAKQEVPEIFKLFIDELYMLGI